MISPWTTGPHPFKKQNPYWQRSASRKERLTTEILRKHRDGTQQEQEPKLQKFAKWSLPLWTYRKLLIHSGKSWFCLSWMGESWSVCAMIIWTNLSRAMAAGDFAMLVMIAIGVFSINSVAHLSSDCQAKSWCRIASIGWITVTAMDNLKGVFGFDSKAQAFSEPYSTAGQEGCS